MLRMLFLHGELSEEVYMQQPQGLVDRDNPNLVCKLVKSLCGLKQAPLAWFECFTSYFLTVGFVASNADSSLFVQTIGDSITYPLLYVDDIIVTGNQPSYISELVSQLRSHFDMTDLGPLKYFLGLEINRTNNDITVIETKYTRNLLTKYGMVGVKSCTSPIALQPCFDVGLPHSIEDAQSYRAIVGALHYLTFSRLDISFSVSKLSQVMHSPCQSHLIATKRVLHYLCGAINKGLVFQKTSAGPFHLMAFSDFDWTGDHVDRQFTIGYVLFLGVNSISWVAKKQTIVSCSSTEVKYRALATIAAKMFWVHQLLKDVHIFGTQPPLLLCDNNSSIQLAPNPIFHGCTKDIEIDFHFIKE